MPLTPPRSVLQAALTAARQAACPRSDAELLAAFAAGRDEAAFAELVRRHGGLIRGVAHRLVGDADAAHDVFQATFLLLARKADGGGWGPSVGPWLYQAARRLAAKARSRAGRRLTFAPIERDVAAPGCDPRAGLAWAEVRAALDDALARLPAHLRDPLVLCYLQGMTQDEAAAALGCSAAAIKGRVARGRERLRRLLARRGMDLSAALGGPLAAEPLVAAGVAEATARAAAAFVSDGIAPPAVRSLLRTAPLGATLAVGLAGMVLACAAAVGGMSRPPAPAGAEAPPPVEARKPAVDVLGDPLPAGAVARLGTRRLRGFQIPTWAKFSHDGRKIAAAGHFGFTVWDAATGRKLAERTAPHWAPKKGAWRADGTGVGLLHLKDWESIVAVFTDPEEKLPQPPARPATAVPGVDHLALSPDATRVAVVRTPDAKQFTIDLLPATPGRLVSDLKPERALGPFAGPCRHVRYAEGGLLATLSGKPDAEQWSLSVIDPVQNKVVRAGRIPRPASSIIDFKLSLSSDARLAAFVRDTTPPGASGNSSLWVRDLTAEKELWSFRFPRSGYGTGHAFTPDGKRLVAATQGYHFQVWDLATGKATAESRMPEDRRFTPGAAALAVSPDGRRFATVEDGGRIDIRDTATGKPVVALESHHERIDAAVVSPDGRLVATMGYDEALRVWDVATGKAVRTIAAPRGKDPSGQSWSKRQLAFTPDGRGLLFPANEQLTMADPTTGKPLDLPPGLGGRREYVGHFSADGRTLVTFVGDTVSLWRWPDGTLRVAVTVPLAARDEPRFKGRLEAVGIKRVTLSPDGRLLFINSTRYPKDDPAYGGYQNANDVWDARTGKLLHRLTAPEAWYPPAAFAPDGRTMYLGGHSLDFPAHGSKRADALTAWDPAKGRCLRRLADPHRSPDSSDPEQRREESVRNVQCLVISPDGRLLAAAEARGRPTDVYLYEAASGRILKRLAGHTRPATDLAFTPDGRRLVSVSEDHTGLVWDVTLAALAGDRPAPLTDAWERLADPEPAAGYAAVAALAAAPAHAVALLRGKLRPLPAPTDADLDRLVKRLDADTFAHREKAAAELDRFGANAVPGVRSRLSGVTSPELRRRLTRFLDRHDGPEPTPRHLRCVRAIAALEAAGTAEANALLAALAKGPPLDVLTREAQAAARRAEGRPR